MNGQLLLKPFTLQPKSPNSMLSLLQKTEKVKNKVEEIISVRHILIYKVRKKCSILYQLLNVRNFSSN